jgi:hypothetical protein
VAVQEWQRGKAGLAVPEDSTLIFQPGVAHYLGEAKMDAVISLKVSNNDGDQIASITAEYNGLDYAHVVDIEDKLMSGVFVPLLDIAKEKTAA